MKQEEFITLYRKHPELHRAVLLILREGEALMDDATFSGLSTEEQNRLVLSRLIATKLPDATLPELEFIHGFLRAGEKYKVLRTSQ